MLLDSDRFRDVNSPGGTTLGDQVLVELGIRLERWVKTGDLVARLGNDEFALLMSYAGEALLRAKAKGPGQVWVGLTLDLKEPPMGERVWAQRVINALGSDSVALCLQPICQTATEAPVAFEILCRLPAADGTVHSPAQFLRAAEHYGLMPQVDEWVINQARVWLPDRPALIQDVADTSAWLAHLRSLGCRFALDDFGAGFSSFGYLLTLPFDVIKLDGTLVQNIDSNKTDFAMLEAITRLAHSTGRRVVAEWVERPEILSMLRALEVDMVQGFLLGRPDLVHAYLRKGEAS